ncbi:MAG: TIR domain-containing protein [Oscillospiraceae bacterium]|nr:TIR domain-containing protein [Oscillospiraceae bacterium]
MSAKISDADFAELLKEKTQNNDPEFQFQVGQCYDRGYGGIGENYAEARKWYLLAAQKGHASAQCNLGYLFSLGYGGEKDFEKAVKWYALSAEQGEAMAQYNLAICYEYGYGTTKNYQEALRLSRLSATQGHWAASKNLGQLYLEGVGVEQDWEKALEHFKQALADSKYQFDPAKETDIVNIKANIEKIEAHLAEIGNKREEARKAQRTEIFVSYARKDIKFLQGLQPHLNSLENAANIVWWDDTKIKSGEKWEAKIKEALAKTKVAILLVSANFFASDYIWQKELPTILEAAEKDGATILWLPVSTCYLEDKGILQFQSVIKDLKKPLDKCQQAKRHEVYTEVVRRIKELFKE